MDSSVYYIIVALMFASATLSIVFFLIWKTLGKKPHALSWSIGFLAASLQWFVNLQASHFPNHEVYWLTVNAFALVLITLGLHGHRQRSNYLKLPKSLWPITAIVYAGVVWTTAFDPHVGLSVALIPLSACVTLFFSAYIIINQREVSRPAEWAAAISMALFALSQGIAGGMALSQGATGDAAYQALYIQFNFLTLPAGYIATGTFVILMIASDISIDMKEIAISDQLTGVLNRRGLGEQGARAYATARRTGQKVSVVMTDIDRFKFFNDEYGHAIGDEALAHFAGVLKKARRTDDVLARVGGEEFALILPGTGLRAALKIADELCSLIEASPMKVENVSVVMTASFGVAEISASDTCLSDTIARADRALYRSKRAGRNQVDLESSQLMLAADGTLKSLTA